MLMDKQTSRKRGSRHKRSKSPLRMRLTERDKLIIKKVNDFRIMRQDQVQRLLFPSKNTVQVRLRLLWEHGFLKRIFPSAIGGVQTSTIYYMVDKRGVEILRQEFGYDDDLLRYSRQKDASDRFLEHTIGISEIRLAVELSCQSYGFTLKTWHDEKVLKGNYDKVQVRNKFEAILPDAYFVVEIPDGVLKFFLEYDRGPEKLSIFQKKIAAYWAYFRSGKCEARYGTTLVRMLTVTETGGSQLTGKRLANIQEATRELGAHTWFWFTNLNQVSNNDFLTDPIWWQPGNCKSKALHSI